MKIYKIATRITPVNPNMPPEELASLQRDNASLQQDSVAKIKAIMDAAEGLDAPISKLNELLPGVFDINTVKNQINAAVQKTDDFYNVQNLTGGSNLNNFVDSAWINGTTNTITSTMNTPTPAIPGK